MNDQQQYCESLYQEYEALKEKTHLPVYPRGGKIIPKFIDANDLLQCNKVKKELAVCCIGMLDLSPSEWFDIGGLDTLRQSILHRIHG